MSIVLQDDERRAFENYLLAGEQEALKKKALESLVEGSAPYYYLYFIDKLKSGGVKSFDEKDKQTFVKFTESKQLKNTAQARQVKLWHTLLSIDVETDENEKQKLVDYFTKEYLKYDFSGHVKPAAPAGMLGEESSQEEDEQRHTLEKDFFEVQQQKDVERVYSELEKQTKRLQEQDQSTEASAKQVKRDIINLNREALLQLNRIGDQPYHQMDFSKFIPEAVYQFAIQFAQSNQNALASIQNQSFFESIYKHIQTLRSEDPEEFKCFTLMDYFVRSLTIQQMDTLSKLDQWFQTDENFIGAYFEKQFSEELSAECQEILTTEEKLENLERLHGLAKSQGLPKAFQREFLEEILNLGPKVGKYSKVHFREYIDITPKDQLHIFLDYKTAKEKQSEQRKVEHRVKATTNWCQYIQNVRPSSNSSGLQSIIDEYLNYFCEQANGSLSEFDKDFKKEHLQGIERTIKVYLAKDGLKSLDENLISLEVYKQIADQVTLEFSKANKEIFEIQEEVSLEVIIKNIKNLHVKVFEFNTETYYKKNLMPFNTSVNLDGLDASESFKYTYEQGSNIRHREVFKLPSLTNKIGLFIVELIGNGVSARAVIKKGSLSLVHRSTVAGHLAYILDAKKKICVGDRTGVWFDKKYYPADKESGRIFIPYGKTDLNSKIIMINDDFAQIGDFTQKTESYQFNAQFYLHQESVLVGSSTNIIVRSQLLINGRRAALNMLKNVKIVLTTYNYIDNIPVTKTFQNLSFKNDEELSVSFQVPPNLRDISAVLTCEVLNATTKKMENFSATHKFDIISPNSSSVDLMAMPYLRKIKGNHQVSILGKNGEPRIKQKVDFTFEYRIKGANGNSYRVSKYTNKKGIINLGSLVDVLSLTAETTDIGARAHWRLSSQSSKNSSYYSYPHNIEILEGESIDLPINLRADQTLDRKWITFIRRNNGIIVEDWFDRIKLQHYGDADTGYDKVEVNGLLQGNYHLEFISGHRQHICQIQVHKGNQWDCAEGFILKKFCLQENMRSAAMVKVAKIEISNDQIPDERENGNNNNHHVSVTVDNCSDQIHLHAFAHQFIPGNEIQFVNLIEQLQQQQFSSSIFPFAKWQNMFQSNKHMADEIRYVFDRKQLESQLGNTLDRPTLLNKRNFVQKTTFDQEVLHAGDQFNMAYEMQQQQAMPQQYYQQQMAMPSSFSMSNMQPMSQRIQNQSYMMQNMAPASVMRGSHDYDLFGGYAGHKNSIGGKIHGGLLMIRTEPNEFYNFLKCPPLQKLNISPIQVENGQATFKFDCDLTPFTQLVVIAVDKESVTQKTLEIDVEEIQRRDLRQKNTLNPDEGLTESRITLSLKENETDFIKDITSTEVQIVDDLVKVSEILSEIRKLSGTKTGEFDVFDFVKKWHTFSNTEKDRYYSDYCCHELNFFIYKKDYLYFKQTVRPFLQCKMEKQFIDYYLLGDTRKVVKYAEMHQINQLNSLEKCLLIDVLRKCGQSEKALSLSECMQLQYQSRNTKSQDSVNYANKIFDLVLNLNTLNDAKSAIEQLKDKKEKEKADIDEQLRLKQMVNEVQLSSMMMRRSSYDDEEYDDDCVQISLKCESFEEKSLSFSKSAARSQPKMMQKKAAIRSIDRSSSMQRSVFNAQDDLYINDERKKALTKQGFEEVEATSEYIETNYYKNTSDQTSPNYFALNQYWCDYAKHLATGQTVFLSQAFTDCTDTERHSFFVICTLDLQMVNSGNHNFKSDAERGVLIQAASNLLLFKKEIKACGVDLGRNDIMVIHRYKEEQMNQTSNEDESGKPEEFLARTAYTCEVIITNVAPKAKQFSLLYQVPEGSIPLRQTKYMKSQHISLQPYTTQKVLFQFYFPSAGKFQHFPSNISVDGVVTARGGANEIVVVDARRLTKLESFQDLIHGGSKQDILDFLKNENLYSTKKQFNFWSILWLLKDAAFFDQVIKILKERNIYEWSVWQYAFYHKNNFELMRECLMISPQSDIIYQLGAHFKSGLIDVDQNNADQRTFTKHLEYHPMVNSRAHLIGKGRKIMNQRFRQTYDRYLSSLIQKKEQTIEDKLILVYYLQLQDRVQEAIDLFQQIQIPHNDDATLRIQYDYLQAYFDFFSGEEDGFKNARRIVQKYDNYPISSWRMMFLTIADQLNEFDGEFDNEEEMIMVDFGPGSEEAMIREQRKQNKKNSQKREPNMTAEIDSVGTLHIETVNLASITVKYYIINAELLFSRQPFLKDNTEGFSYVKPFHTLTHQMLQQNASEEESNQYTKADIKIPDRLLNQNMVIEITSGDLQKFLTFYSNQLKVTVLEQYGELKVTHAQSGLALPKTYVKVFYQKKSGGEMFYRDGYTDIRGKIEYAQTSGDKLKDVKRFAILVQNDNYGSKILECDPPKGVTGNDQPVSSSSTSAVQPSFAAQKMARLENRQEYASKNKMNRK